MNRDRPLILVVDDDIDNCRNLADILGDLGYRVDTATDGPSALELVRANRYDVALLDLRMPGMDGLELYREIKRLRAGTVALLITAYAGGGKAEEAAGAGVGRSSPSRSTSEPCCRWSTRRWASRWSWSSTTTRPSAQPLGPAPRARLPRRRWRTTPTRPRPGSARTASGSC